MATYLRKLFAKNPSNLSAGVDNSAPMELYEVVNEAGEPVGLPMVDASVTPLGHQTVTVTNTAQTLAALLAAATATAKVAIPAATRTIWFQPAGDVRIAEGGDTPNLATDATRVGDAILADQWVPRTMSVANLEAIKFIAASNTIMAVRFEG